MISDRFGRSDLAEKLKLHPESSTCTLELSKITALGEAFGANHAQRAGSSNLLHRPYELLRELSGVLVVFFNEKFQKMFFDGIFGGIKISQRNHLKKGELTSKIVNFSCTVILVTNLSNCSESRPAGTGNFWIGNFLLF